MKKRSMKFAECHKIIGDQDHKLCNICLEWKPCIEEYYYKNVKNKMDGYNPYCIICTRIKTLKWKSDNPEHYDMLLKRHRQTEKYKEYHRNNEAKLRENGSRATWNDNNRDKIRGYRIKKEENKTHTISKEELMMLYEFADNSCMYCGISEEESREAYGQKLHREHAINDGSNGIDNCVLACRACNSSKREKDWNVWYVESNKKFNIDRYNQIIEWLNLFDNNDQEVKNEQNC